MVQPGDLVDRRGVPIYPGDLVRSPHFVDRRRRRYYLYHTAVCVNGYMELVPTQHLQPDRVRQGGRCMLSEDLAAQAEVIAGYGPGDCLDYLDRPKRRRAVNHDEA